MMTLLTLEEWIARYDKGGGFNPIQSLDGMQVRIEHRIDENTLVEKEIYIYSHPIAGELNFRPRMHPLDMNDEATVYYRAYLLVPPGQEKSQLYKKAMMLTARRIGCEIDHNHWGFPAGDYFLTDPILEFIRARAGANHDINSIKHVIKKPVPECGGHLDKLVNFGYIYTGDGREGNIRLQFYLAKIELFLEAANILRENESAFVLEQDIHGNIRYVIAPAVIHAFEGLVPGAGPAPVIAGPVAAGAQAQAQAQAQEPQAYANKLNPEDRAQLLAAIAIPTPVGAVRNIPQGTRNSRYDELIQEGDELISLDGDDHFIPAYQGLHGVYKKARLDMNTPYIWRNINNPTSDPPIQRFRAHLVGGRCSRTEKKRCGRSRRRSSGRSRRRSSGRSRRLCKK